MNKRIGECRVYLSNTIKGISPHIQIISTEVSSLKEGC